MLTHASCDSVPSLTPARMPLSRRLLLAAGLAALPLSWLGRREPHPQPRVERLSLPPNVRQALSRARAWGKPLLVYNFYCREALADLWLSGDVQAQAVLSLCESCRDDTQALGAIGRPAAPILPSMVLLETSGKPLAYRPLFVAPYQDTASDRVPGSLICGNVRFEAGWQQRQQRLMQNAMRRRLLELRNATPRRQAMRALKLTLARAIAPDLVALRRRADDCMIQLSPSERGALEHTLQAPLVPSESLRRVAAKLALVAAMSDDSEQQQRLYQALACLGDATCQRQQLRALFPQRKVDDVELDALAWVADVAPTED